MIFCEVSPFESKLVELSAPTKPEVLATSVRTASRVGMLPPFALIAGALRRLQEGTEVVGALGVEVLPLDDGAALVLDLGGEGVGDALAVHLVVRGSA